MVIGKKRKFKEDKRKRNLIIGVIIILALLVFGLFLFRDTPLSEEQLVSFKATGQAFEDSFISTEDYLNQEGQFFAFVDVPVTQVSKFTKTYESSNVHRSPASVSHYLSSKKGEKCNVGEVIRYKFCQISDSQVEDFLTGKRIYDKSNCNTDIFAQLWQVQDTNNDHPITKDYSIYTKEFYYTYSCYEPGQMFADDFEKSYLVNGKCVGSKDANGRGTDYGTEKYCLIALQQEKDPNYVNPELEDENVQQLIQDCKDFGGNFNTAKLTCEFAKRGCTDSGALNYDSKAEINDNSCVYQKDVFTDTTDVTDSTNPAIKGCNLAGGEVIDGKCEFADNIDVELACSNIGGTLQGSECLVTSHDDGEGEDETSDDGETRDGEGEVETFDIIEWIKENPYIVVVVGLAGLYLVINNYNRRKNAQGGKN